MSGAELVEIADNLAAAHRSFEDAYATQIRALSNTSNEISKSWSGSNLGYHACVYYADFQQPPPGTHFSSQWGFKDIWASDGTTGDWREYPFDAVTAEIFRITGHHDLNAIREDANSLSKFTLSAKVELLSILTVALGINDDKFLHGLKQKIEFCNIYDKNYYQATMIPSRQIITGDHRALSQGFKVAPHQAVLADMLALGDPSLRAKELSEIARQAGSHLFRLERQTKRNNLVGTNVFIGHGRSPAWRVLKDFVKDRLGLPFDEFNRVPIAGITNIARLNEMLESAKIAFLILTAEDELADGTQQARMNVIHEVGLFQGRLGFTRAIVLLEQGCEEFSNIQGLGQIRFPKGNIAAAFEEIRLVLEREGIIND